MINIGKHLKVAAVSTAVVLVMVPIRSDWSPAMHPWNKAAADVGFLLIAAALAVGPLERLSKRFKKLASWAKALAPWARALGIWGGVWTFAHVVILLYGWSDDGVWISLKELFGVKGVPFTSRTVFTGSAIAMANIVGAAALFYCAVLFITSNDMSQRILGKEGWKSLHRVYGYSLFVLAALHTAFFLYLFYGVWPGSAPPPNFFNYIFPPVVIALMALRTLAFTRSIK